MTVDEAYEKLGLEKGADLREVVAAWKRLSKKNHPDYHLDDKKSYDRAVEIQKELNVARDTLRDWFEKPDSSREWTAPQYGKTFSEAFDEAIHGDDAAWDAFAEQFGFRKFHRDERPLGTRLVQDAWLLLVAGFLIVLGIYLGDIRHDLFAAQWVAISGAIALILFVRSWNSRKPGRNEWPWQRWSRWLRSTITFVRTVTGMTGKELDTV